MADEEQVEETVRVEMDLTREEARLLIDSGGPDDRLRAWCTGGAKLEAAIRAALGLEEGE